MALTPGHRNAEGERYRTFAPDAAILRCFSCHSTGQIRLGPGFKIEPSEPGVQCETCHGPGADHATSLKPIRNPKRLSATQINDVCGGCHRKPAAAGDDTDWTNPWNTRHQPLYLAQSTCFERSKGALTCFTCHAPHQTATQSDTCVQCHKQPKHRTAIAGRACVSCHMPAVVPQPNLKFANHWIGVYAAGKPLRPIARPSP